MWLDIPKLTRSLLRANQNLKRVKYFTARISGGNHMQEKVKRQSAYLDVLTSTGIIDIVEGKFHRRTNSYKFSRANTNLQIDITKSQEKQTDVNIAVQMIDDAMNNRFDIAFLFSADSDLIPPVNLINQRYPKKRVMVWLPPKAKAVELKKVAPSATIYEGKFKKALFPESVEVTPGVMVDQPAEWK